MRVQITSAPSAVNPDSAIATWTAHDPFDRSRLAGTTPTGSVASYGAADDSTNAMTPTITLSATAVKVARVTSYTRSR